MEYRSLLPLLAVFVVVLATHTSVHARRRISNTDDLDEESGHGESGSSDDNEPDDENSGSEGIIFREDEPRNEVVRKIVHPHQGARTNAPNYNIRSEHTSRLRSTTTSVYVKGIEISGDEVGTSDDEVRVQPLSSLLRHPAILAGIIAGAVLTILFVTLLVMFLVYRMRKKDEGSYVLDDPKMSIVGIDHHTRHRQPHQQSSSALVYTKGPTNDREFYA